MPKALSITITYDPNLQKITGKDKEVSITSEGTTFMQFLLFLFEAYPEIQTTYPPGKLGFTVNGNPPKNQDLLKDGDVLYFVGTGKDGVTHTPWGFHGTFPASHQ